ncbi:hypothetical protein K8I85_19685 [bacterium]|nr:hypothetical protein [bacterium]
MNLATIGLAVAATFALTTTSPAAGRASHALPDEFGGVAAGIVDPTLDSIQANVFTPGCALSFCHGEAMSAGLDLRAGNSYASIVDVPSAEFPVWDRIEPFFPDQSYLICKLEACPSMIGQQMPLIGGPIEQPVIDVIREWVEMGAPETGAVSVDAATWGQVKASYR